MSTKPPTLTVVDVLPASALPCAARLPEQQTGMQFARLDVLAGQKGLASRWLSPGDDISTIQGRAANDSLVTLSIIAPFRLP